ADLAGRAAATAGLLAGARTEWLAPGAAVDIHFRSEADIALLRASLGEPLAARGIDCVVQRADGRRKKLLVADMDSTIIGQECIDELADMAGIKPEIAAITERAMRGEIAFEPALRERVALLAGLPEAMIATVLAE